MVLSEEDEDDDDNDDGDDEEEDGGDDDDEEEEEGDVFSAYSDTNFAPKMVHSGQTITNTFSN